MTEEKMIQIYEMMADITLSILDAAMKSKADYLDNAELDMVRTTLDLYDTVSRANPQMLTTTSALDFSSN
ncbi:MAG: hypothetical protein HFI92_06560 [Lachnospiraceae bacterium]|nr:hypothetical protein [Lachnospiraceae bacterium]